MTDFILGIFDSEPFMPHGQCFLWYPEILWLHVLSDIIITIAYFSIPSAILYILWNQKRSVDFKWVYVMFGAFIFLCGVTHLLSIIVLWQPIYRFEGVVKALTASVSIATAFLIMPAIPNLLGALKRYENETENEAE